MKNVAEQIFAHAVSLEQAGRQKNRIFGWQNVIFIFNYDKTVLLRFEMKQNFFEKPIGFFANDYDSDEFCVEGDTIVFTKQGTEFQREKKCSIPDQSFEDVDGLFFKYINVEPTEYPSITIQKESLELFNIDLSHIELEGKEGKIIIRQRDIYSGTVLELTRPEGKGFQLEDSLVWKDDISQDFGPIGIRTTDFLTLFTFHSKVQLYLVGNYFIVEGKTTQYEMTGVIGGCLYDELGIIEDLSGGGRQPVGKKLSPDLSVEQTGEDAETEKPTLTPRQIPSSDGPLIVMKFKDLTPGTPEWRDYWESHPELQHEMLDYKKELENGRQEQENGNTQLETDPKNQTGRHRLLHRRAK